MQKVLKIAALLALTIGTFSMCPEAQAETLEGRKVNQAEQTTSYSNVTFVETEKQLTTAVNQLTGGITVSINNTSNL